MGKSTYLSFLCQTLKDLKIPLIRHHYFLTVDDRTNDRISPKIVSDSLLYQIRSSHKGANANISKPENLHLAIKKCAKFYKSQNIPFVVLVDGLDHVWGVNAKNKKPLDELFRQLLPVADNMILVVGTQPVDDNLLPDLLLTYSPRNDWLRLPEMTGDSIYDFLKYQLGTERLRLDCQKSHLDDTVKDAARMLLCKTNGYPLLIIYCIKYLALNGKQLTELEIKNLPTCRDNNIKEYYYRLWSKLTYKQKDVLILISGLQFTWPQNSLSTVIGDDYNHGESVNMVSHLLSKSKSGVIPFHESLVVFTRSQPEYKARINELLPSVNNWLDEKAPKHLKDAWLWSTIARTGNSYPLRQGVSRDWILDQLTDGMPIKTCIRLLSEAESYAFDDHNFAETYKHKALKTRLLNGPESQTCDAPNLGMLSLFSASEQTLEQEISSLNRQTTTKLSTLAICLWHKKYYPQAKFVAKKAIDLHATKFKLLNLKNPQEVIAETQLIIKAAVLTNTLNYDEVFEGVNFSNWPDEYMNAFKHACISKNDIDLLLRARTALPELSPHIPCLELAAIRISIIEGAEITARSEYKLFTGQKLSSFMDIFNRKKFSSAHAYHPETEYITTINIDGSTCYHFWYFSSLCTRLEASGDFSWLQLQTKSEKGDISAHYNLLNRLADIAAEKVISGELLTFDFMCSLFPHTAVLNHIKHGARSADADLKKAWLDISSDCHLTTTSSLISFDTPNSVLHSKVFGTNLLRMWYNDQKVKLLTDDAMAQLVKLELARQKTGLEVTNEYSNNNLELSEVALRHHKLTLLSECLRRTWDFVIGFGHYDDHTGSDVLKAIKYLSFSSRNEAISLLEQISPIIFNISNFSQVEDVKESMYYMTSLLSDLNPQTAASIYDQELKNNEWHNADETLLKLIKHADFSTSIVKSLFLTGLHPNCYQLLQKQIDLGNESAIKIAQKIECQLGNKFKKTEEINSASVLPFGEIKIHPSEYQPKQVNDLTDILKGKFASSYWKEWYQFWVAKGEELELLKNLLPIVSTISDGYDARSYLLDYLFESQKKLRGKTKAFKLLVTAHNTMNGWSYGYESTDSSLKRLKIVAHTYPERVDEFIKLTTTRTDSWSDKFTKLIVSGEKLVYLLVHSNRKKEALELTKTMVSSLFDSVRNLPLKKRVWDWGRHDNTEQALAKTLVSRLKLPVPSIKLWVSEQISELLLNQHPDIDKLVTQDLSLRTQESECVEVLSLLLIAKDRGYSPPNDLGKYVNARSSLTDIILKDIDADSRNFGLYSTDFTHSINFTSDNHNSNYSNVTNIQLHYELLLDKAKAINPKLLKNYFRSEWNKTFKYFPASSAYIDYFLFQDRFRNTGAFYTRKTQQADSVFLHVMEFGKRFHKISNDCALDLSKLTLPIETAYIGLSPKKPKWLPTLTIRIPLTQENISNYIRQCIERFDSKNKLFSLAAFSFPINIDENTWVDITLIKALTDLNIPESFYFNEHAQHQSKNLPLERTLRYKFNADAESKVRILASYSCPHSGCSYWHGDLYSRGLYVPKCFINKKTILGKSKNGDFYYTVDGSTVGYSSYWNNNWKPTHPKDIPSLCGTYTALKDAYYTKCLPSIEKLTKQFYICEASILSSNEIHNPFNVKELKFVISV